VNVLAIDTASEYLVLGTLYSERALLRRRKHAETLMSDIESFLRWTGMSASELQLLVAGEGPGSYTGIRIAIAAATGLGRALGVPVVGASSLQAVVDRVKAPATAALPARSGHVYALIPDETASKAAVTKLALNELVAADCLLWSTPPSGKALARAGEEAWRSGKRGVSAVYL